MKITRLLPFVSVLGIGLFAVSCDHYNHQVHRPGAAVGQYRTGYQVRALPPRYQTINLGGTRYYYADNVYYRPHSSGYIVVDNPRGTSTTTRYYSGSPARTSAVIRTLPRGHRVVTYNGLRYYQHGDSYYQPTRGGYYVVASPYQSRRRGWR